MCVYTEYEIGATEWHRRGALALDGEGPSDEEEDDDSYEAQYLAGCDGYI